MVGAMVDRWFVGGLVQSLGGWLLFRDSCSAGGYRSALVGCGAIARQRWEASIERLLVLGVAVAKRLFSKKQLTFKYLVPYQSN